MIRQALVAQEVGTETEFRWRGGEISRLEGFSDAVFALALTLLIVTTEAPQSFDQLVKTLRGFPAFGICFGMLVLVWYWHYKFFRRYGLQDIWTIALNALLLFVVVFYVYPLRFLFTLLVDQILNQLPGFASPGLDSSATDAQITNSQVPYLLMIYGLGYLAVNLVFTLLYAHAYRQRGKLALNPLEAFDTQSSILEYGVLMGIGALSVTVALGGAGLNRWSGPVYILIGPALSILGTIRGNRRRQLEKQATRTEEFAE